MAKILFVEDNFELAGVVKEVLGQEHHVVDHIADGREALERLQFYQYDLLILDVHLPSLDGFEICRQFRASGGTAQILMLTAKREITEKEEGLDAGADDYLTKPFHSRELAARIRALLRRPRETQKSTLTVGQLTLDPANRKVRRGDEDILLVPQQFALLEFFMKHPNQVFSAEALMERLWSAESDTSPDVIRVHITRLRSKIDQPGTPSIIRTIHRVGYVLDAE